MDRSEDADDRSVDALLVFESQASQIMRDLLGSQDPSGDLRSPSPERLNSIPSGVGIKSFDPSSSSLGSHPRTESSTESGPKYHFHGLASTQTQTQYDEPDTGSQKENTPSSGSGTTASQVNASPSKSKPSEDEPRFGETNNGQPSSQPLATRPLQMSHTPFKAPAKAVSFLSPKRTSPPPPPHASRIKMPIRQTRRSPSPASQDSFAGPSHYDAAQLYITTDKNFGIPISELGRGVDESQSQSQSDVDLTRSESMLYNHMVPSDSDELPQSGPSQDHSQGRVLVQRTPSNSSTSRHSHSHSHSHSQSQSQDSRRSQRHLESQSDKGSHGSDQSHVSGLSQEATAQGQPSMFDEDYLDFLPPNLPVEPNDPSPQSSGQNSQPSQEETSQQQNAQTQVSSQSPQETQETQLMSDAEGTAGSEPQAGLTVQTSRSSAYQSTTHSLASSIPAGKRGRYKNAIEQGLINRVQNDTSGSGPTQSVPETEFSPHVQNTMAGGEQELEEIQMDVETQIDEPMPMAPPPQAVASSRDAVEQAHPVPVVDEGEIVPDSEPPQASDPTSPTRKQTKMQARRQQFLSPATPRRRAVMEKEEEEMVDDSLAVARATGSFVGQNDGGDDDDDELRLTKASAQGSWNAKGKGRAMDPPPPPSRTMKRPPPPPLPARGTIVDDPGDRTQETEIPSSEPQQDLKAQLRQLSLSKVTERPTTNNRKGKGKRQAVQPDTDSDEEDVPLSRTVQRRETELILKQEEEEGEGTEPADDNDEMEVDDDPYVPGPSSRKRKRQPSRGSTLVSTPPPRTMKRLRTGTSTVKSVGGTRVLVLWKPDKYYYTGMVKTVLESSPPEYRILYDDEGEDTVELNQMRVCRFVVGDSVRYGKGYGKGGIAATVVQGGESQVTIKLGAGATKAQRGKELEVPVADLKVHSLIVDKGWNDRKLLATDLTSSTQVPKVGLSPSPSKASFASIDRGAKSQIFKGTAFLVTLKNNDDAERKKLNKCIHDNGGKTVDDWTVLLSFGGGHVDNRKRYQTHSSDVALTDIAKAYKSVVLVADECNMKPKFLIALALGVPCLSDRWLRDHTDEANPDSEPMKNWNGYLLPAGYVDEFGTRVSQFVDYDHAHRLSGIVKSDVPFKLFKDKSVLCIGSEFFPLPKNARGGSKDADGKTWIPRIVLAMGASQVDAVAQAQHAPSPSVCAFDYVIISSDEKADNVRPYLGDEPEILHWPSVKECLIAGRWL